MLAKLFSTIGFLVLFILSLYLNGLQQQRGTKIQEQRSFKNTQATGTGIATYGYSMTILLLSFVEFWLLTGVFPYAVVLLLMVASLVGIMVQNLLGAITGFSLRQEKINVLTMIWGAKHPVMGMTVTLAALIMIVLVAGGSLYNFWKFPVGSAISKVRIAFFLFIVQQLFTIVAGLAFIAPMITSENVDDDVRNFTISKQLSILIYSAIFLTFPLWIFREDIAGSFGQQSTSWLYVAIFTTPLLLFLVGGVFPFFLGTSRYRAQSRSLFTWRRNWLREFRAISSLPSESTNRSQLLEQKMIQLNDQIGSELAQNELPQIYYNLGENGRQTLSAGLSLLKSAIQQYEDRRRDWDVRFHNLEKLEFLARALAGTESANIRDFIDAELKEIDEEMASTRSKRNVAGAALLAGLPGLVAWLFRTYQDKILNIIGSLAPH